MKLNHGNSKDCPCDYATTAVFMNSSRWLYKDNKNCV